LQVVFHNDTIDIIQSFIVHTYSIFPRNYGLLFDETESMGSVSEDGDLDETDNELDDDDPDSMRIDAVSTYSLTSHNAPDLVMDLPVNASVDSSESAENLCATLPSSTPSSASVLESPAVEARPRAISLNIDLDGSTVGATSDGASPMLAERKANLAKLGGIPVGFCGDPRNPKTRIGSKLHSPTSAAPSSADSNESLNQVAGSTASSKATTPLSNPQSASTTGQPPPTFPKPSLKK
jgi:hypothetical protein